MLKSTHEHEGLEGWQQLQKLQKQLTTFKPVYSALDYDMKFAESKQETKTDYKEQLTQKLEESGLQYYNRVKKYGKDGMKAIQSAT